MNLNYNTLLSEAIRRLGSAKMSIAYKTLMAITAIMLFIVNPVEATHYRYGNISWSRVNDNSRIVTFTVTTAWRRSFFSPTPVVGSIVNPGMPLFFGNGASATINLTVTSVNVPEDWFVGVATITYTYPAGSNTFTAYYQSNARLQGLMQNNAGLTFRSETVVQIAAGNGNIGSPVSSMPAIIALPVGQAAASFNVPAIDPDNQSLTYSLAAPQMVSQTTPYSTNPSGLAINSSTGAATFNTVGKTIGHMWNGFFLIKDASNSSTIVDFIMLMVEPNTPPIYNYSVTPANNFVYSINPAQNLTFSVEANCPDPGSTVTLTAVGLPSGNYTLSPALPTTANPVSSTFSFTPSVSQLGIYLITFTATRNGGVQTSTTVIVNVNTNPLFIAPSPTYGSTYMIPTGVLHQDVIAATNPDPAVNTSINTSAIPGGASLSPSVPTAFALTPTTTLSWTPVPSDFGDHTVTFGAIDANGRLASHSYILSPNSLPAFASSSVNSGTECALYTYNITVSDPDLAYGDELHIVEFAPLPAWLTLTDNEDGTAVLSGTPPPGSAGNYTISLIAEDLWHHAHPDVLQTYTLTIDADATAPVPDLSVLPNIPAECQVTALTAPTATDNCVGTVTGTHNAILPITAQGTTVVTWTYDDGSGNTSTQTQNVVIDDITAPVPDNDPLADVIAECQVTALTAPTATDNCVGTVTGIHNAILPITTQGTTVVTWTYDDGNGNTSTQTQNIVLDDVTAPVADITSLPAITGECSASVSAPTATDNCVGLVTGTTTDPTTYSTLGTYTINWTYDDGNGNTSTQAQTVIVYDIAAPEFSGVPSDAIVQCNSIPAAASVTANDNCAGALPVNYWQSPSAAVTAKLSHLWKADGNYLDAIGSANGTPVGSVSFGSPVLGSNGFSFNGAPGYISTGTAGSVSGTGNFAISAWINTTSSSSMVIIQQRDANFIGEYMFKIGGNHNNGDLRPGKLYFLVYGTGSPVVDLFSSVSVNDGKWHYVVAERNGAAIRLYADGALVASGSTVVAVNMTGTIKTTIGRDIRDNNSNFNGLIDDIRVWTAADCPSTYGIDRIWTAQDNGLNLSAAVQHINVEDTQAPMLAGVFPSGNSGMNLCKSDAPTGPAATDIVALFGDNCGTVHAAKSGSVAGNNDSWSVTYTYDVYDDCNNHVSPSPTITYSGGDQSAPVPDLTALATVTGECSAEVTTAPTATDNCEGPITGTTTDPTSYSVQGTYTITWTFDDGNGNTSSQTQTVIVDDVTPPTAVCSNFSVTLAGGSASITAQNVDGGSSDNCSIASVSVSPSTFSCSDIGIVPVILTVTDVGGNSSSCTAYVTVQGMVPVCSITAIPGSGPYTGGPATTIYLGYGPQTVTLSGTAAGGSGFTYSWGGLSTGLLSCTNCASPVFTPNSEGRYVFTLTATNSNGCSTTCTIEICVLDIRVAGSNNKVYLCHVPPGNPNNPQTLSISVNAVPAHIPAHVGDHLGKCSQSCDNLGYKTGGEEGELIVTDGVSFETIVYPNPFSSDFTVTVETESLEPVHMKIYDLTGRMMMEVRDIASNAPVKVSNDLKDGFYLLQIQQGDQVQNIKIIKRR